MPEVLTTIMTPFEVSLDRAKGLLCCALEGGSNYWYLLEEYKLAEGITLTDFKEGGRFYSADWTYPYLVAFHEGCGLVIEAEDYDEDGKTQWIFDREAAIRGLRVMSEKYPRQWSDFVLENDDADTGDCFLQCSLYNSMVFC